jgi:hypothetical protein
MHLISTDPSCEKTSNQALFEDSVNLQSKICPHFRTVFAVAKLGSPPYCGEALRNEKFSLHHTKLRSTRKFQAAKQLQKYELNKGNDSVSYAI